METKALPHTAQLRALLLRVRPLAAQAQVEREHWIFGEDESASYCEACALLRVAALRRLDPAGDYELDGGYDIPEHDSGGEYCDTCHVMLEYTLTNYGAEEELAFYLSADRPATLTPEDAYQLVTLLDAYDGVPAPPALQTLLDWLETVAPAWEDAP